MKSLSTLLAEAAPHYGFPFSGGVDIDAAESFFNAHRNRFTEWLNRGYAGEMSYLERGKDRRLNPRLVFPDAQAVFCVGSPYPALPPPGPIRYARYLQGPDYHTNILDRLNSLFEQVNQAWITQGNPSLSWKACIDTSAVLERSWASLSGLGWIGKNTLLIHPEWGSYFFIGVVLLNLPLHAKVKLLPDYCGKCERCLKACPTNALTESHWLDSKKCISYLTLEKKGPWSIEPALEASISPWIAGCDICQESCPFNFKVSKKASEAAHTPFFELISDPQTLVNETEEDYKMRVKFSALKRVKFHQFKRNLESILKATPAE